MDQKVNLPKLDNDLSDPGPIQEEAIETANEIMRSGRLFRYGEYGSDSNHAALLEEEFAAYLGTRYAGAPKVRPGRGNVAKMGYKEVKAVQTALERRGYDVGGVDGTLGAKSRAAVRDMQLKLNMPADGYPTPEFLRRIR